MEPIFRGRNQDWSIVSMVGRFRNTNGFLLAFDLVTRVDYQLIQVGTLDSP